MHELGIVTVLVSFRFVSFRFFSFIIYYTFLCSFLTFSSFSFIIYYTFRCSFHFLIFLVIYLFIIQHLFLIDSPKTFQWPLFILSIIFLGQIFFGYIFQEWFELFLMTLGG